MEKNQITCDFCHSTAWRPVYLVPDSPRLMEVGVCHQCGLVQSLVTRPAPPGRAVSLSSGADWGNVRHGKGLRLGAALPLLNSLVPWDSIHRVLDIGSNRGDFVHWVGKNHPSVAEIVGVEPDATIVDAYKDYPPLQLYLGRLENVALPDHSFDLVYCSHTLEHADSAADMLQQISAAVKKGGYLFLEVPNIDSIKDDYMVEEFFIEKHLYHFNRSVLCDYLTNLGFKIKYGADSQDDFNITLIAVRESESSIDLSSTAKNNGLGEYNEKMILDYGQRLEKNRERLKKVASQLNWFLERQKVAFWGASRIFDALVRYGGLATEKIGYLVDEYLHSILPFTYNIPIKNSTYLKIAQPQVVIVLARSSAQEIVNKIRRYGIKNVIIFRDLMANAD